MRIRENPNDVSDVFSDVLSVVSNSNGNDAVHCQGHIQCPPSHTPQKLGRPRGLVGRPMRRCDLVCYYLGFDALTQKGQQKAAHVCRMTMNRRCTVMCRSRRQ